jgi:hypothetical protein
MPIFAPLDNPFEGVMVEEIIGVWGDCVEVEDGCVEVRDGCVEVGDGCEVVGELETLSVVEANAFKSELCHHTGMPSPNML